MEYHKYERPNENVESDYENSDENLQGDDKRMSGPQQSGPPSQPHNDQPIETSCRITSKMKRMFIVSSVVVLILGVVALGLTIGIKGLGNGTVTKRGKITIKT